MGSPSKRRRRYSTNANHVVGDSYFIESSGEQRYQVIGMSKEFVLLLVVLSTAANQIWM